MATKYQVTELDRALEQFKGIDEWTNEQQLEWQLRRSEESAIKELQRMAEEKAELYTDNVLLKREIEELKKPNHYKMGNELLMRDIEVLKTQVKKGKELISQLQKREETHKHIVPNLQAWRDRHAVTIQILEKSMSKKEEEIEELKQAIHLYDDELTHYRKLKSALFPLIERLWAIDSGDRFALIKGEKKEIINTIAYRIANEWID